jgi:DNA polymerase III sliding clamp (beta) subunit (PCNA family)
MSIIVKRQAISEGLARIEEAVDATMPQFGEHIKLQWQISDGRIRLHANGYVAKAITNVQGHDLSEAGNICVSSKVLRTAIDLLPAEANVRMSVVGEQLVLEADGRTRNLPGRPSVGFPQFPKVACILDRIPAKTLQFLLDRTSHVLPKAKEYSDQVCIHIVNELGAVVASAYGNNCLAVARTSHVLAHTSRIVLNQRAVAELNRALRSGLGEHVEVGEQDRHLFFRTSSTDITIQKLLVEPPRPPTVSIGESRCQVVVARTRVIEALRNASELDSGSEVRFSFNRSHLVIESKNGISRDIVECKEYCGDEIAQVVHGEWLRSALAALEGESIQMFMGPEPSDPIKIKPYIDEDVEFTVLPSLNNV